ncbi:MAG: PorP/SprF family type IX secretion system membrane protein [Bacteroidota bacterium]
MRNLFYVLTIAQILICCTSTSAQNYAVYNSYAVNPYLYNPAEVATDYTYLFVNHRQQWMDVEGAPMLSTININTLLNQTRAGVGAKISSFKRGILNTTDLSLTYAYGVPLSQKSTMFLGLSGGAITNSINLTEADPDDPAIANYLANNIQPAANFGMLLKSGSGLNFGVVLPQLFTPKFNSANTFENTGVSPFDNVIVSAYYRRKVEGKLVNRSKRGVRAKVKTKEAYAPLEFYLLYKHAKAGNSQFEAMTKLNLSENMWLGASYRQSYGFTGLIGFTFNKFLLSYSYEPGNQPEPVFSKGTHEIQLGLRLGDLKKFKRVAPVLRSTIQSNVGEHHTARFQQTNEDIDNLQKEDQSRKKFYVVIRAFADFNSADAYKKKLVDQKYNANVFYYEKDRKYYVHVLETTKQGDAHEEAKNLKTFTKLKDAKVLTVIEPKQ